MSGDPIDQDGTPVVLGSYVRDTAYAREGRVIGLYPMFSETPIAREKNPQQWLSGQSVPITKDERAGRWASVLLHNGGSAVVPLSRLHIIDPFGLNNGASTFYFGQ